MNENVMARLSFVCLKILLYFKFTSFGKFDGNKTRQSLLELV